MTPPGLCAVGGHLGHHLAGGDAQRARQPHALPHRAPHGVGGLGRALVGQLQVALVQAEHLDGRRHRAHQLPHAARPLAVVGDVRTHEDHLGAAAQRLRAAHRRADAERPGGVAGRRHDAAPVRIAAHHHRPPAQLRTAVDLHRGEERVDVEVGDHQVPGGSPRLVVLPGRSQSAPCASTPTRSGCRRPTWRRTSSATTRRRSRPRRRAATGPRPAPGGDYARLIARKGREHERSYLERLGADGREVVLIDVDSGGLEDAATLTDLAMREGAEVIYQGAFADGGWRGRADFLERVRAPHRPRRLGLRGRGHQAEPRPGAAASRASARPSTARRSSGSRDARPSGCTWSWGRAAATRSGSPTSAAYVRRAEAALRRAVDDPARHRAVPVSALRDLWVPSGNAPLAGRAEDHLSAVAGIRRGQVERLRGGGDRDARGARPRWRPTSPVGGLRPETLDGLRDQARLQVRSRRHRDARLGARGPSRPGAGSSGFPAPSEGDVFLDLEGDPFWEPERELTFLFGIVARDGRRVALRGLLGPRPGGGARGAGGADRHAHRAARGRPGHARVPLQPGRALGPPADGGAARRARGRGGRPPARRGLRRPLHGRPPGLRGRATAATG